MSNSMLRPSGIRAGLLVALMLGGMTVAHAADDTLWRKAYTGEQATGKHVISLWQFKPGAETQDNSGHGHDLILRGETRFADDGQFGNCLHLPPTGETPDTPQGAQAPSHPDLTPPGAFTLELWLRPRETLYAQPRAFLLDKKKYHYATDVADANHDYCFLLTKVDDASVILSASLGYDTNSDFYNSQPVRLIPGSWYHAAFTYDGRGTGQFFLDGEPIGSATFPDRGPISAGTHPLVIGDRAGSTHARFPGCIEQVRITRGIATFLRGTEQSQSFETGALGPPTSISGNWHVEMSKLVELSDAADEAKRPFFATLEGQATDNVVVTVGFEAYDQMGEVLVSPAWTDQDNYVAVVWVNQNIVRLLQVRDGEEAILAEKQLDGVQSPVRLGAAISGQGLRAYVNGEPALEAGAIFQPSRVRALGGRYRTVGFNAVDEEPVTPWTTARSTFCPVRMDRPAGRSVFYRMEKDASMVLTVRNLSKERLPSVKLRMSIEGFLNWTVEQVLEDIAPSATVSFNCAVPADRLRPDVYTVSVHADVDQWASGSANFPFTVVARPNPNRFPVLMWGSVPDQNVPRIAELGFTAVFATGVDFKYLWDNPQATDSHNFATNPDHHRNLNDSVETIMKANMNVAGNFSPGYWLIANRPEFRRVLRPGEINSGYLPDICPRLPAVRNFCRRAADAMMSSYAPYPAFTFLNLHSELRDNAEPCFHPEDVEAYREATGLDVPDEVARKAGVNYKDIPDFPENRIVPDDHLLLTYFRWYWKQGDAWVPLNDAIFDAVKKVRPDIQIWHDPAVRVAPTYGSGGRLDMIGNWTYSNPAPVRIGMTTDELLCMAQGRQKVMQTIQTIWYRTQTAPKQKRDAMEDSQDAWDPWDDHDPDAAYITPSPAHMTEAFWTAISRPIDMIGYHGAGAIIDGQWGWDYTMTHRDTADALGRMHKQVIEPFGPMLRQLDNRPADVACLESFASQVFAQSATFGWARGHIAGYWLASQYAGLQSDVVYDETVVGGGLDRYKVLIMADCPVLTQSVYESIVAFQQRGGIVIADERLTPAITPDIRVPMIAAWDGGDPLRWQAELLATAEYIRKELDGRYEWFVRSENPQVVIHARERDDVQYVFAINDCRQFGNYVGPYGKVMEDGLPAETTITIRRGGTKVIDLMAGEEVPVRCDGPVTQFDAALAPGGGNIYVIMDRMPAAVRLDMAEQMERGETAMIDVRIVDDAGQPVAATVPFEIRIEDPAFRAAEPSGFYAAVGGEARVTFELAENERTGLWRVTVVERMRGTSVTRYVPVR